jgi:hypothetical protein
MRKNFDDFEIRNFLFFGGSNMDPESVVRQVAD